MKETGKKPQVKREVEIDIIPILKALLTRVWLMVLVGAIFAGAAYGVTKLSIKPTYRSGFTAYVNNQRAQADKSSLTNSDLAASQQLTKTFSYIIRSNSVLSAALKSIDSPLTYSQLSGMVSAEIRNDTELISIYVVNTDPQMAYDLATAIASTAPAYLSDIVEGSSMKIVDYPVLSNRRYGPNYIRYALLGFFAGFLLIAVIEIIRYFKDDSVKDENELETTFAIPVLGVIPDVVNLSQKGSNYYYYNNKYGYSYAKSAEDSKEEKE